MSHIKDWICLSETLPLPLEPVVICTLCSFTPTQLLFKKSFIVLLGWTLIKNSKKCCFFISWIEKEWDGFYWSCIMGNSPVYSRYWSKLLWYKTYIYEIQLKPEIYIHSTKNKQRNFPVLGQSGFPSTVYDVLKQMLVCSISVPVNQHLVVCLFVLFVFWLKQSRALKDPLSASCL